MITLDIFFFHFLPKFSSKFTSENIFILFKIRTGTVIIGAMLVAGDELIRPLSVLTAKLIYVAKMYGFNPETSSIHRVS
jgi:hypothetical protein